MLKHKSTIDAMAAGGATDMPATTEGSTPTKGTGGMPISQATKIDGGVQLKTETDKTPPQVSSQHQNTAQSISFEVESQPAIVQDMMKSIVQLEKEVDQQPLSQAPPPAAQSACNEAPPTSVGTFEGNVCSNTVLIKAEPVEL